MRYNMSPQQTHKEISHMLQKHINIEQLTSLHVYYLKGINANISAKLINIGKDKAYRYYKLFKQGFTVTEIFSNYKENKKKCGRKKLVFSDEKIEEVNSLLNMEWSVDAICGRDKLIDSKERCSTKTLYKMVSRSTFDSSKLRRKGKRKPNNHKESRGKINTCKTIHERDEKYPNIKNELDFGHFEGDTIVGKERKSAIVTLVEKKSKYIVLLKVSRKSKDVLKAIKNWLDWNSRNPIKTIVFDRGKEFSMWKEMEEKSKCEIYFSDPGSPGQRGLNENSNGIVRKDLPKSTDLSIHSQEDLIKICNKWNSIPRKSLGYFTPEEVLEMTIRVKTLLPIA